MDVEKIFYYRRRRDKWRNVDSANLKRLNDVSTPTCEAGSSTVSLALLNARSLANKTFMLHDLFTSRDLDFLFITETWLQEGQLSPFSELLPQNCTFINSPRQTGKGGGLATIFKSSFYCQQSHIQSFCSFELQAFELKLTEPILCVVIYRPPKFNKDFIHEFSELLAGIAVEHDRILIIGDFNIHICCPDKPLVKDFLDLIDSFDFIQSVVGPTHSKGHTQDLVLSHGLCLDTIEIFQTCISDHFPVLFSIKISPPVVTSNVKPLLCRTINSDTALQLNAILAPTTFPTDNLDIEALVTNFNNICSNALNTVAPLKIKSTTRKKVLEPWLNETTRALRRECRRAERRWKKDKLQVSFQILRDSLINYQKAVKLAKSKYFITFVASNRHRPQVLFNVRDRIVNPSIISSPLDSVERCEAFSMFFIGKIEALRGLNKLVDLDSLGMPQCPATLEHFQPVSMDELKLVINHLRPSNYPLDCLPTRLIKDIFLIFGSYILKVINTSLQSGCVPSTLKHAVVKPLLKKSNLDPSDLANFRPISKLPFLSKILEKLVFIQLEMFLKDNNITEKFQSGFKVAHSTESALLRVYNDLLLTVDSGNIAVLLLLDLSSAFDTVDHQILLHRLKHCVGLRGSVFQWFKSYLENRTFSVHLDQSCSGARPLKYGVPQGSILGPILFILYLLPLGKIFQKFNISFHCFADDIQIYLPLKLQNGTTDSLQLLLNCLAEVKLWMEKNFLHLNESKTQVLLFGQKLQTTNPDQILGSLARSYQTSARNLGFTFDSSLKLHKQVSSVVKSSFYHLRLLAKVKSYFGFKDFERLIHAFITTRLDYCNSLYRGMEKSQIQRLQMIHNAAARLLTGTRKHDHIRPTLASLHWLPVFYRIDFKILLLTFKVLNGLAPPYLRDLLNFQSVSRTLRSNNQLLLTVPRTRLKRKGDRAFSVAAPVLWNNLPFQIRSAHSLDHFKSLLKTHFYSLAFK
uniref:Reverse transcriptase domain-containing protein n=3 Tax=Xiphophorus maculatus TaxID=8083 RepID=A0A3B5PWL6_XIPMA